MPHDPPARTFERPRLVAVGMFLAVFLALLISRWRLLDSPPTPDQARTFWLQAAYLADTGFDYRRLLHEEQAYARGGALTYNVTCTSPTVLALIMRATPTPRAAIIAYRLVNLACAAFLATLLWLTLRPWTGALGAALAAAALVTTPLVNVQIDLLGIDVATTAVALWATRALWRDQFVAAALWLTLASAIKTSATIVAIAAVLYIACLLVCGGWREATRARRLIVGLVVLAAAVGFQLLWFKIGGYDHDRVRPVAVGDDPVAGTVAVP